MFLRIAGIVKIAITESITGMSSTKDTFCPNSSEVSGTVKGESVTETPETSTRLNMFAPITLPRERSVSF